MTFNDTLLKLSNYKYTASKNTFILILGCSLFTVCLQFIYVIIQLR